MATTQFVFGLVPPNVAPAMRGSDTKNTSREEKTPSGTSAATTAAASLTTGSSLPVCRVSTDTQVYVSFGAAPNATSDTVKFLIPANAVEYFYVNAGDKAAVVTG